MMDAELEQAIAYRQNKDFDNARETFASLYERFPQNPLVNYHYAWLCDTLGEERRAVPFYETAIANGLAGDDLRGALLGLGSTYRALGEYQKSVETLEKGLTAFPEAQEFVVFLAMAHYNLGEHHRAMTGLLHLIADYASNDGIVKFRRAIHFYASDLDTVWE